MRQILILAGDSDNNLGDKGILTAMCQEFIEKNRQVKIGIISSGRYFAEKFPENVCLFSRGYGQTARLLLFVINCDLLICGGGGLFQDDDSRVKMPYWGLRVAMFRLFCKRIVGYSIGAGPLKYPLSRYFARLAFFCMESVSVRDENAVQSCSGLTGKTINILPDPALLLRSASSTRVKKLMRAQNIPAHRPLLGVTIRRWFHHVEGAWIPHKYAEKYHLRRVPDAAEYQQMIILMAQVLDRVVVATNAYILFMPTYNSSHEADDKSCKAIMAQMESANETKLLYIEDPSLYKGITAELDSMLASRMHPLIFAAGAGTPVVGLSYNQKFDGFFKLIGAGDNLLDIRDLVQNNRGEILFSRLCSSLTGNSSIDHQRIMELQGVISDNNQFLFDSL